MPVEMFAPRISHRECPHQCHKVQPIKQILISEKTSKQGNLALGQRYRLTGYRLAEPIKRVHTATIRASQFQTWFDCEGFSYLTQKDSTWNNGNPDGVNMIQTVFFSYKIKIMKKTMLLFLTLIGFHFLDFEQRVYQYRSI